MKRTKSITARLSLVFLTLLLMVILLGALGIGSLSYFNSATAQVRNRWLPSSAILTDLTNATSDFRAAEASRLLAVDARQLTDSETQLAQLDRAIGTAQDRYRQTPQDATMTALYARFTREWRSYRQLVERVRALASEDHDAAVTLYNTESKVAYDAASDALDVLTNRSIDDARAASEGEELAYRRACWLIATTIALAGLCVAAALTHVQASISAPILSLADRMHRLAGNETGIEIDQTDRDDEIAEMARAVMVFRDNAVELLNSRHALESQAGMLRERLAEERRLMMLQRNFVSMASHEFRTPITIIDAHAQRLMAMKDRLVAEDVAERARKIRGTVRRMTQLISSLIDASRVMDGAVQLYFHPASLDLTALLHEACTMQREISPQAQILEHQRRVPLWITGDSNLLLQVFSNLLSNAIKYSPGGGLIDVRLTESAQKVVVAVRDHGLGIAAAERERLFERYFRGSNTVGIVGTGVGLYFVKTVVELHGGAVSVQSNEGRGSCFTVQLPLQCRTAADPVMGVQTAVYELANGRRTDSLPLPPIGVGQMRQVDACA